MYWRDSAYAPPAPPRGSLRAGIAGLAGALLVVFGGVAVAVTFILQQHAPQPSSAAAGSVGFGRAHPLTLRRSVPVSVRIPAIGVTSYLLHLGVNADGAIQVPSLYTEAGEAAWYKYSVTPGQVGAAVIEGHVDSYQGPAVFFRLGALRPGNQIDVTLADGITAVFRVTGVREYAKDKYPAEMIYGPTDYAALRLITCGGDFDYATHHYLSSVVVFAVLSSGTGPPAA